jgi:abortive infection bacteriophage resistance protein
MKYKIKVYDTLSHKYEEITEDSPDTKPNWLMEWKNKILNWKKKSPIKDLIKELKNDPGYRIGWVANIAMTCYDEIMRLPVNSRSNKNIHTACNKGAEQFLNLLCK